MSYKFVSFEDWELNYKSDYPLARVSPDSKEVVLSCNGDTGELTAEQAISYIAENWINELEIVDGRPTDKQQRHNQRGRSRRLEEN